MKIVGIEPGKRVNPVVRFREAKQHSHKATFPQDKCLGVLSACDVTPGFLETANKEFQIIGVNRNGIKLSPKQSRNREVVEL